MIKEECVVIAMATRNSSITVVQAVNSALGQVGLKRSLVVLISDDGSTDGTIDIIKTHFSQDQRVMAFQNRFGSASRNRNWIQEYVKANLKGCVLLGRLDADDTIAETGILSQIERLWEQNQFDVLLMANHQLQGGVSTGHVNRPESNLTDSSVLLERVQRMASGEWMAELPSCNVFVRPDIALPYPDIDSAEDHWNLVDYLLRADDLQIAVKPDWVYCNYSIDSYTAADRKRNEVRSQARSALYRYALDKLRERDRKQEALKILKGQWPSEYTYLGAGFSGVVFHDGKWVYKVHLPLATNNFNEMDNILFLKEKLSLFNGRHHFFPLRELTEVKGKYILVYPFEAGEKVESIDRNEMLSFLAEMWQMKVICRSITKGNNFIRVNGVIKLIDYEIEPYDDNLFLNVAARAFIQLDDVPLEGVNYNKLKRSTINNFSLNELQGFYPFVETLFRKIANTDIHPVDLSPSLDAVCEDGVVSYPEVTLLIKCCPQDSRSLYNDVRTKVSVLTQAVHFAERVLLIDRYKERDFLRQYTEHGSIAELTEEANRLLMDGIIDRIMLPPNEAEAIRACNEKSFGVSSDMTHTANGVPVTAQMYAFQNVETRFVLQMDVDVLIGNKVKGHDYLVATIEQLKRHKNAVSAGFQIYHENSLKFQEYTGFDGSVPPDVRCSLIDTGRLIAAFPLPNSVSEKGWELSWYRSLEKHQKETGLCSLRGGDTSTFYVHIQNYRKANRKVWWRILQGVLHGHVPVSQAGNPEVTGTIFDWSLPKRNERLVVVLVLDRVDLVEWTETLSPILEQTIHDVGLVIINNTGDITASESIRQVLGSRGNLTIIDNEHPLPFNEAVYDAIHYYLTDQDSFICLMRQGDILLYRDVLREVLNRMDTYGADVLIGKEISAFWLKNCGKSVSNFLNPRFAPDSMVNGLAVFRKYLFDALSHLDLKERVPDAPEHIAAFTKIKRTHVWMDDPTMLGIIVPTVELSSNPIRFDNINMLRLRPFAESDVQRASTFLKGNEIKKEGAWEKGRKTFIPNITRIELDITYECNLKCHHCNRSCTQAPTETHMTLGQVKHFIEESIEHSKKWHQINVLGGEPTIHPQFEAIVQTLLYDYIIPHSPKTTLQITSNGFGDLVQSKLAALPQHPNVVIDYNSFKTDRAVPYFTPFNLAPMDDADADSHEYHKGCWVTSYCGIGLNHLGYFACGVAGGIERILKAGKGIQSLAELDGRLQKQLETYCRLCGNFSAYAENRGDFMERAEKDTPPKTAMSPTWRKLYREYNHEEK